MKNLYIVYTPYQLLSCLNISVSKTDDVNEFLFVTGNLIRYKELCDNIPQSRVHVYESLFKVDKQNRKLLMQLNILKNLFKLKRACKSLFNEHYDCLYVPSNDITCRVVFNKLKRNGTETLYLYDDGLGTYDLNPFKNESVLGRFIYNIFLDKNYSYYIKGVFCYNPELMAREIPNVEYHKITLDKSIVKQLEAYCGERLEAFRNRKVIFLDQGCANTNEMAQAQEVLKSVFTRRDIIVKKHPRIESDSYEGFDISNDGLPFEAIVATIDLKDCIIISHSSSACVTPFLLFNHKVKAVLLYEMVKDFQISDGVKNIFLRVKKMSGDDSIFIPETMDEFRLYLEENSKNNI